MSNCSLPSCAGFSLQALSLTYFLTLKFHRISFPASNCVSISIASLKRLNLLLLLQAFGFQRAAAYDGSNSVFNLAGHALTSAVLMPAITTLAHVVCSRYVRRTKSGACTSRGRVWIVDTLASADTSMMIIILNEVRGLVSLMVLMKNVHRY